jgi:hypothetical protein
MAEDNFSTPPRVREQLAKQQAARVKQEFTMRPQPAGANEDKSPQWDVCYATTGDAASLGDPRLDVLYSVEHTAFVAQHAEHTHPCLRLERAKSEAPPKHCFSGANCPLRFLPDTLCPQMLKSGYCDRLVSKRPCAYSQHMVFVQLHGTTKGRNGQDERIAILATVSAPALASRPRTTADIAKARKAAQVQSANRAKNLIQLDAARIAAAAMVAGMRESGDASMLALRERTKKAGRVETRAGPANIDAWRMSANTMMEIAAAATHASTLVTTAFSGRKTRRGKTARDDDDA